ncbi:MAG: hypothetical protein HZA20_01370 [Nitrospirae bacterium]|nr:hypothetical protein [Nitrospirota bacterium]
MSVLTIPRILRDKLGEDGADALAEVINVVEKDAHGELALKDDIRVLERKLDALEHKLKQYFIILVCLLILLNPHAVDLIAKLFGVVK